jgi:hypothetical protein
MPLQVKEQAQLGLGQGLFVAGRHGVVQQRNYSRQHGVSIEDLSSLQGKITKSTKGETAMTARETPPAVV